MREIAGNGDITLIQRITANFLQAREQVNVAIALSVVFIAGIQRAASKRNS
jgi:hypothetical protein